MNRSEYLANLSLATNTHTTWTTPGKGHKPAPKSLWRRLLGL